MATDIFISTDLDFDRPGKQLGYLRMPHSVHRSAYGHIPIPIGHFVNGEGPRVLITAGNHGDEYEGQVVLSSLMRRLEAADVKGRLTLLPMMNFPAAEAGLRTSPIDQGNLNRAFVGEPTRGPTWAIAHYVEEVLMPGLDLYADLHAGGSSLTYKPSVFASFEGGTADRQARLQPLLEALAMPCTLLHATDPKGAYSHAAAWRKGVLAFTIEAAGAGRVTPAVRRHIEAGMLRVLREVGSYVGKEPIPEAPAPTQYYQVENEHYLFADEPGLFEPLVEIGESVRKGQPAALIHRPETPGREPIELAFPADGEQICLRVPARVIRGDCLLHLAAPIERPR